MTVTMKESQKNSYLINASDYIDELYECYLKKPELLSSQWQEYFTTLNSEQGSDLSSHYDIQEYFKFLPRQNNNSNYNNNADINNLGVLYNYRALGHFQADLDPLGLMAKISIPELNNPSDPRLASIYCRHIGAEFMHITNQTEIRWIADRFENPEKMPRFSVEKQKRILACLTAADGLEKYLGSKYVGQKRFSLEGGDSLIPLLDNLIQQAGTNNIKEMVIGMAHRGRLNVLVNILGKSPQDLFDEFEGKVDYDGRTGDVKYHMGFSSDIKTAEGALHLALAFNPSHLEIVSPVTLGSVRARQRRHGFEKRSEVLGVQIHGDAAFAGQGVVMETFALSQTEGFGTGGTIHIVINNQVGFTTDPKDARSTFYCTDIAKMIQAPIFHVNGDDPEAVVFVTELAFDYRMKFGKDVVIDLMCYRRHGHNEADEPSATQPVMYQAVKKQATPRQIYADTLIQANHIDKAYADFLVANYRDSLDAGKNPLPSIISQGINQHGEDWMPYIGQLFTNKTKTGVKLDVLKKLGILINTIPPDMTLQPQVLNLVENNQKMAKGDIPVNWGFAENLAYATLLNESYSVRLTGQDCERGTFAHRHAVWHDYQNGDIYIPLKQIGKNYFGIFDSILSEAAVLGFEYGYASTSPSTLVLWEAQFGDFANGAQVVIDQFISSAEQKWGRLCGLVMLLPHGQEGMGPEHSSARLERYLQLCAQDNMQVCVPTTPAQIFHLLRRQMVRPVRKPLIIMSPKSLLRHKLAVSSLTELSDGNFQPVMPEIDSDNIKPDKVTRIIFCAGKIYYELLEERRAQKCDHIAIIRLEELYPFPDKEIKAILSLYKRADSFIWCQEEPENQGAWFYVERYFKSLNYIGLKSMAAPASGSGKVHTKEQKAIIARALLEGN